MQLTTPQIAQAMLGMVLQTNIGGLTSGIIVETEAYLGVIDKAAHAYQNRRTKRNAALFDKAGTVYVYQMRNQFLLNIVTKDNQPECVLIRGIEPLTGQALMQQRRYPQTRWNLTNGPGKLCRALAIDLSFNDTLLGQKLSLLPRYDQPRQIITTARVGIPNKEPWTSRPLRYFVAGNPYVSGIRQRQIAFDNYGWQKNKVSDIND
ncbi:MAG: DNA-3-methyladenine glycosylase [Candidatus Paralactobacillus gallistercoris]|uniref:Putative 3-methyladenine DNA glycosylase n=1 Tax=Candidatus Paralactobacillus gallistercoris TaxID=2838724 RepID=A0A948TK02_9LACO|nr:DNA-3-methyladenine glycosylase [Candidatus Paralactobacillus gallistercoris]